MAIYDLCDNINVKLDCELFEKFGIIEKQQYVLECLLSFAFGERVNEANGEAP